LLSLSLGAKCKGTEKHYYTRANVNGFCLIADRLGDFVVRVSESKEDTKILLKTVKHFHRNILSSS